MLDETGFAAVDRFRTQAKDRIRIAVRRIEGGTTASETRGSLIHSCGISFVRYYQIKTHGSVADVRLSFRPAAETWTPLDDFQRGKANSYPHQGPLTASSSVWQRF